MYYVYIHYRATDLTPFYVGKGSKDRAYNFKQRSSYWKRVYNKHGVIVKIQNEFDNETDAFNFERYLIKTFKENNIPLTNLTDGGEGTSGLVKTIETKQRHSQAMLGNTNGNNNKPPVMIGKHNPSFKGFVVATSLDKTKQLLLDGKLSAIENGFDYRKVNACVNGKRLTHKGFTFERMKEN